MEPEKDRNDELWHVNCIQLTYIDSTLIEKDEVIAQKDEKIACLRESSKIM